MNTSLIHDFDQVRFKQFVNAAIMLHYGWEQSPSGKWVQGAAGRPIPKVLEALNIKRKDFFHRLHVGGAAAAAGERTHTFFNEAQDASAEYNSNFTSATLPTGKFYVLFGIQAESAAGASATDDQGTLDYGTITEDQILNGIVSLEVNNKDIFKNEPVKSKFLNEDGVPNFLRLPVPVVLEPDEQLAFTLKLAKVFAAADYRYVDVTLLGVILEK